MKVESDENVAEKSSENAKDSMELLEEALVHCKFGKFHVRLLVTTLIASCSAMMVTTNTSFLLPNAECDLKMTIMQKGFLSSMPFFGQVSASMVTGFITDTFGRKRFLVAGLLGIFISGLIEGSSQVFWLLSFGKLMEGICSCFCFTTPSVLLSELVHRHVRDKILLLNASFMSISLVVIALIAWAILPYQWNFVIIDGHFVLHSWNIYLYVCCVWSLVAAFSYYFLPESPKYLLSHGQENEALEVLKDIYCINTGEHRDTFPITSLSPTSTYTPTQKESVKKLFLNAMIEVKRLIRKPLCGRLILFSVMTFVCLLAYSSLRMWFPQISTLVENYRQGHNQTDWFCEMITEYTVVMHKGATLRTNQTFDIQNNLTVLKLDNVTEVCVPNISGTETYTNGIMLGLMSFVGVVISTYMVGIFGHKLLMLILLLFCAASSGALYWTRSLLTIALLISATCGFMQTTLSLQQNLLVRAFPTTLRTISVSIILMIGRIGSLLGSILFPVMLTYGCMVPFLTLTVLTLSVAGLVFFLPTPNDTSNNSGDK